MTALLTKNYHLLSVNPLPTGGKPSLTAYDKNDIKIVIHFGKDRPRADVQVMVVSVMSTKQTPVKHFKFQAAVPKVRAVVPIRRAQGTCCSSGQSSNRRAQGMCILILVRRAQGTFFSFEGIEADMPEIRVYLYLECQASGPHVCSQLVCTVSQISIY